METPDEPVNLRFLRRLVTVLTATMILGLIVVISLLVIRLSHPAMTLPASITLPDGVTATAFTQGPDWIAITSAHEILIYNRDDMSLRQRITIDQDQDSDLR